MRVYTKLFLNCHILILISSVISSYFSPTFLMFVCLFFILKHGSVIIYRLNCIPIKLLATGSLSGFTKHFIRLFTGDTEDVPWPPSMRPEGYKRVFTSQLVVSFTIMTLLFIYGKIFLKLLIVH